jgi:hypothetical protein
MERWEGYLQRELDKHWDEAMEAYFGPDNPLENSNYLALSLRTKARVCRVCVVCVCALAKRASSRCCSSRWCATSSWMPMRLCWPRSTRLRPRATMRSWYCLRPDPSSLIISRRTHTLHAARATHDTHGVCDTTATDCAGA